MCGGIALKSLVPVPSYRGYKGPSLVRDVASISHQLTKNKSGFLNKNYIKLNTNYKMIHTCTVQIEVSLVDFVNHISNLFKA